MVGNEARPMKKAKPRLQYLASLSHHPKVWSFRSMVVVAKCANTLSSQVPAEQDPFEDHF